MSVVTSITGKLGLNTVEWETGAQRAKRSAKELAATMDAIKTTGVAVGLAFAAATAKAAMFADQVQDLADGSDFAVESVLGIQEALSMAGSEASAADRLIATFNKQIGEAASGSETAQKAFAAAGVSLKDLASKSNEELLKQVSGNLAKMDDAAKRAAISTELLGRGAKNLNFEAFNEELQHGVQLTEDQKQAFKDAANAVDIYHRAMHHMDVAMVEFLGGAAKNIAEFFAKFVDSIIAAAHWMKELKKSFDAWNTKNTAAAGGMSDEDMALTGMVTGGGQYGGAAYMPGGSTKDGGGGNSPFAGRKITPGGKNKDLNDLLSIYKVSQEFAARLDNTLGDIDVKMQQMVMLTQEQVEVSQLLNDIENQRVDTIGKLEVKLSEAKEKGASKSVLDAIRKEIEEVNTLAEAYKATAEAAKKAEYEKRMSAETGWAASARKYQEMSINAASGITESVDSVFNNMTKAMDTFVQTGKFSFKDFANSVIQDILRIQMRMAMAGLISKIINVGIGAFGSAGAADAGGSNIDTGGAMSGAGNFGIDGARAGGGDVTAGNAYIVGEKGPELFYPQSDGAIQPNGGGGRGTTVVNINNTINAIDASSFDQKVLSAISNNCKSAFAAIKQGEMQMGAVSFT